MGAEEVDFHGAAVVEGDGEGLVELELILGGGEGLETFEEEFFGGAAGFVWTLGLVGGVDEELGQGLIDAVADEAADAGGVVLFPLGVEGKGDFDRPAGEGARGEKDGVADGFVAGAAAVEHAGEHGDVEVGVVVDLHHLLAVVEAMKSAGVLCDGPAPGDGHGEEEGVEAGVIEAFADEFTGRDDDARFVCGDVGELFEGGAEGFFSKASFEGDDVLDFFFEEVGQELDVLGSFGQDEGSAARAEGVEDF
ncbi:MAG: hypothetical protein ACJAVK_003144 [Akkermansiaceae bacterium]